MAATRRTASIPAPEATTQEQESEGRTFAYLRVSTSAQDIEKDKANILMFVHKNKWEGGVAFVEDANVSGRTPWRKRALGPLVDRLKKGDRLVVPELSRLARTMFEAMEVLAILQDRGVGVYDVRNKWELNGTLHSKVLAFAFGLAAELERNLISQRTKEGLAAARKRGAKIGRPRGPGKSKLDPYRDTILEQLKLGVPMRTVAKRFRATTPTLIHWLKRHGLYPVKVDRTPVKPQPQPESAK